MVWKQILAFSSALPAVRLTGTLLQMSGACPQSCRGKVFTQSSFSFPPFQVELLALVLCQHLGLLLQGSSHLPFSPLDGLCSSPLLWCLDSLSCGAVGALDPPYFFRIPQCAAFTPCLVLHFAGSFCAPWGCWRWFSPGRGWLCAVCAHTVMQQPRNPCIPSSVACSGCFVTWGEWLLWPFPGWAHQLCLSTRAIVVCHWKPQAVPQGSFLWLLAVCGTEEDAGTRRDDGAALRGCCPGVALCWHIISPVPTPPLNLLPLKHTTTRFQSHAAACHRWYFNPLLAMLMYFHFVFQP